jgi:hypothetical protein
MAALRSLLGVLRGKVLDYRKAIRTLVLREM